MKTMMSSMTATFLTGGRKAEKPDAAGGRAAGADDMRSAAAADDSAGGRAAHKAAAFSTADTVRHRKEGGNFRFLALVGAALLASFLLSFFVVTLVRVAGPSMEPALPAGSWVLVSRTAYAASPPKAGDIIVFYKKDVFGGPMIKRVAGIGGDRLRIEGGVLYRNDEAVADNIYITAGGAEAAGSPAADATAAENAAADAAFTDNAAAYVSDKIPADFPEVTVPAGTCFVMGDNSAFSSDSRVWEQPFVPYKDIIGEMIFRLL